TLAIPNQPAIHCHFQPINQIPKNTPYLSNIPPSSSYSIHHLHQPGPSPPIINEFMKKQPTLHPHTLTFTRKTLPENNQH
ncbi:dihydroxy-acid dehydratase domain-containing protein, partial [Staphylococcus haemolyticus]|uniref:dihydroxy-acid dehydratase domain-containing protein n=1 Tax=Staphylococcus haemolyticus TaxID=1283 RepID=UPI0016433D91